MWGRLFTFFFLTGLYFRLFMYLCIMEKNKDIDVASKQEADIMREKAENYLVCFIDGCPLRESCLRWVAGQYVDPKLMVRTAINPRNPLMGVEGCPKYREKVCVKMMRGMTRLYHEMPGYMESGIRNELIAHFGRKRYFQMRKGEVLINPDDQQFIAQVCQKHGWTAPLVYDGEEEDWLW